MLRSFSFALWMFAFSTVVVIDILKFSVCPVQKLIEWTYAWRMEHMSYFQVVITTIQNRYVIIKFPTIIMCFKM